MVKEIAINTEKALERWGFCAKEYTLDKSKRITDIASSRQSTLWVVIHSGNTFNGF